jgi:hypothetical protein
MWNSSKTQTQRDAKKPGDVPAFMFVADARTYMTAAFHRAAAAKIAGSLILERGGA